LYQRKRRRNAEDHQWQRERDADAVFVELQRVGAQQGQVPGEEAVASHTQTVLHVDRRGDHVCEHSKNIHTRCSFQQCSGKQ